jgi:transcriptional regulator of acetoin/glycerol metabolism
MGGRQPDPGQQCLHQLGGEVVGAHLPEDALLRMGTANGSDLSTPTALRDVEKQQIINALEQTGWHRGKTASLLGISPSTLYRRLRDYHLEGKLR